MHYYSTKMKTYICLLNGNYIIFRKFFRSETKDNDATQGQKIYNILNETDKNTIYSIINAV
jgi:ferritin